MLHKNKACHIDDIQKMSFYNMKYLHLEGVELTDELNVVFQRLSLRRLVILTGGC